jgi:hypothetical protein
LSGLLPYAQAEAVMQRIGKRTNSDSSLWRTVERQGSRLTAAPALTDREATVSKGRDQPWHWGKMLSMDGGLANIRHEGWKELKVGLIGNVVSDDPPDSSVIPEVHTAPLVYTALLGEVEAFTPALVHAAQAQGFFEAAKSSIPAAGVPWIWSVADRHFPHSTSIVDGYPQRNNGAHLKSNEDYST